MAPRFRVRADVLHYVVMLAVGAGGAYAFSRMYGLSDEEIENELRTKYPLQIRKSENQHEQMQDFFNKMKNSDKDLDEKFSGMLKAGRGGMKRHHDLEPTQPALPTQQELVDVPKALSAPTTTSGSSDTESSVVANKNGWWNGWGWFGW